MMNVINETLLPMVNDGSLSMDRISSLVYIKEFIDRIASKHYLDEGTAGELQEKYGVRPNLITWGDYFQTEMATSLLVIPDEEFLKTVETLKFDMVASWIIFCEKDSVFFEWVDDMHATVTARKSSNFTEEEEEILHLKILKDYYTGLGLVNNFTESEMLWFSAFQEARVV
jgi:hypothetical protein